MLTIFQVDLESGRPIQYRTRKQYGFDIKLVVPYRFYERGTGEETRAPSKALAPWRRDFLN